MIKRRHARLKHAPGTSFSRKEFEGQRDVFLRKLARNVDSYFYLTHDRFDRKVFRVFESEFAHFVDFFLQNKESLTRIKLIKRDHEIFLKNEPHSKTDPKRQAMLEEVQEDAKDLDYLDQPKQLWNDLDTRVRNLFIERYIGNTDQSSDKRFLSCAATKTAPWTWF